MSPVAPSSGHAGRALVVGTVAVVVVMAGLFAAALVLGGRATSDIGLGDQTFQGGDAEELADEIADRGPILYPDVSGTQERDLILQHLGADPDRGWYAFRAQPADKDRECTWQWQADEELFRAKCDESLTAPADGEGLESYPVEVIEGKLDVDLNAADRPSTTTQPETTTTVRETGEPPG